MPATLDITAKQEVSYCIPIWLRDQQIKQNIACVPDRIEAVTARRTDPIAVACYGPSLQDTWEALKAYDYVISCSGAHKFLLEKGLVPTWHLDVDPREHKIQLLGTPHPDVEYLPASTVHPKYCRMLVEGGFRVKLWHIFDNKEDAFRSLPRGEWALFGGSDAGHRAMVMARFLGFTDIHIFGMDGCEGKTGKHAAAHPSQPKGYSETVYEGVTYRTTPAMLECVRQLKHEVDQLGDVTVTFHGEGLAQAWMRDYQPKTSELKGQPSVGVVKPQLISAEYQRLNAQLHHDNLAYGVGGGKHAAVVLKLVGSLKAPVSVLDYGCGKGYLQRELPFPIWEYDPAVPGKEESPRPADLVVCTDVLEHIEPDKLPFVLDDLRRCTKRVGYFVVHTGPAQKTLPDGRNTHLIQKGEAWWRKQFARFFAVGQIVKRGKELHCVVGPKQGNKQALKTSAHAVTT